MGWPEQTDVLPATSAAFTSCEPLHCKRLCSIPPPAVRWPTSLSGHLTPPAAVAALLLPVGCSSVSEARRLIREGTSIGRVA